MDQLRNKKVGNFGLSGYGIYQAILSYIYSPINTDTVVLGNIPGDFERAPILFIKAFIMGVIDLNLCFISKMMDYLKLKISRALLEWIYGMNLT